MIPQNNEALRLTAEPEDPNPKLSLLGERKTTPSDRVARQRAAKAHFGLGEASPGYEPLFEGIRMGQEDALRMSAAHGVDLINQRKRLELIAKEEAKRGGPVSPEEMSWIMSASEESATQPFSEIGRAHV